MKVDLGKGTPTHLTLRRDNGVIINQGGSHIMLAPDELAALLDGIYEITGLSDPRRSEKTDKIGNK